MGWAFVVIVQRARRNILDGMLSPRRNMLYQSQNRIGIYRLTGESRSFICVSMRMFEARYIPNSPGGLCGAISTLPGVLIIKEKILTLCVGGLNEVPDIGHIPLPQVKALNKKRTPTPFGVGVCSFPAVVQNISYNVVKYFIRIDLMKKLFLMGVCLLSLLFAGCQQKNTVFNIANYIQIEELGYEYYGQVQANLNYDKLYTDFNAQFKKANIAREDLPILMTVNILQILKIMILLI